MLTRTRLIVGMVMLLGATPASAQLHEGLPLHAAVASYMVLQGVDLATTEWLLASNPAAREANPWLAPFVGNPVLFSATKMTVAAATSWVLLAQHRKHPKIAFISAIAADAMYIAVVRHNSRLIR